MTVVKVSPDADAVESLGAEDTTDECAGVVPQAKSAKKSTDSLASRRFASMELKSDLKERETIALDALSPDTERSVTQSETMLYYLENYVASSAGAKFIILGIVAVVLIIILSGCWLAAFQDNDEYADYDYLKSLYMVFQAVASGGVTDEYADAGKQIIYLASILTGLLVFAVLVGFVNDFVAEKMESLNEGSTKVAISGHTLILGWNEATLRAVVQVALLRRTYMMQNETWERYLFPWTRVKPSTPLAANPIVVMCDTKTKEEMDAELEQTLLSRGISPKRTKVGWDVVCRIGDPCDPHDLLRVGAHRASRILTMLTEKDAEEEEKSEGVVKCGATLRTLLALRNIIFDPREERMKNPNHPYWDNFRCVAQVDQLATTVDIARFRSPKGRELVQCVDLRRFVNSLMFNCTIYPSLAFVFIELMSFEGAAFRARMASELGLVGMTVGDCQNVFQDAIICGVLDTTRPLRPDVADPNEGMACNFDRKITANDRILFIAQTTTPTRIRGTIAPIAPLPEVIAEEKKPFGTLVCGWRGEWNDGARLVGRITSMVRKLGPGSKIVFVNRVGIEKFEEILGTDPGFVREGDEPIWTFRKMSVQYYDGDAADLDTLKRLLADKDVCKFEVAIVLGTMAQCKLPPSSRDLRVLSVMMLLRKVHADLYGEEDEFHVVGENCVDSTSELALRPFGSRCTKDFVNTQAIMARSLVLALAYPVIQPAVAQLCQTGPGLPTILVFEPGKQLVPLGRATFAEVSQAVAKKNSVCLGYMRKDGKMVLAPHPMQEYCYENGDLLIIVSRDPYFVSAEEDAT